MELLRSSSRKVKLMINVATPDTPDIAEALHLVTSDDIPTQLANINYRLDILITIALVALCMGVTVGVCYLVYRFFLRCI